jgi:hypothetical protein
MNNYNRLDYVCKGNLYLVFIHHKGRFLPKPPFIFDIGQILRVLDQQLREPYQPHCLRTS